MLTSVADLIVYLTFFVVYPALFFQCFFSNFLRHDDVCKRVLMKARKWKRKKLGFGVFLIFLIMRSVLAYKSRQEAAQCTV